MSNPVLPSSTHTHLVSEVRNFNLSATTEPTVNDDSLQGYEVGSEWFDTVSNFTYNLTDATPGAAIWQIVVPQFLDITYTGQFRSGLMVTMMGGTASLPPRVSGSGVSTQYFANYGPAVSALFYEEGSSSGAITIGTSQLLTISFNNLTSISCKLQWLRTSQQTLLAFPALRRVNGGMFIEGLSALNSLSLPLLESVGTYAAFNVNDNRGILITSCPALTSVSLPALTYVAANFLIQSMAALTSISCPLLQVVGTGVASSSFALSNSSALTSISFPMLYQVIGISLINLSALTTASFPALAYSSANINFTTMSALTTIVLSGSVAFAGNFSANTGVLTNVTLGTIGTTKSLLDITSTNQNWSSASVNAVLALLVSLDGTGGTTLWGAGRTLNISGGTSAAPSGAGIADKATLLGRGATVTTN